MTPAIEALDRAGITYAVREYEHDSSSTSFGEEAARLLGVERARVFKTLVVTSGQSLAVCVTPVDGTLDLKAAASAFGFKRVQMATTAEAERTSGYVVGAISPVGQKRRLPTAVDESALEWDTIFCSGGRRGLEIELAAADLLAVTGGRTAALARRP